MKRKLTRRHKNLQDIKLQRIILRTYYAIGGGGNKPTEYKLITQSRGRLEANKYI